MSSYFILQPYRGFVFLLLFYRWGNWAQKGYLLSCKVQNSKLSMYLSLNPFIPQGQEGQDSELVLPCHWGEKGLEEVVVYLCANKSSPGCCHGLECLPVPTTTGGVGGGVRDSPASLALQANTFWAWDQQGYFRSTAQWYWLGPARENLHSCPDANAWIYVGCGQNPQRPR